MASSLLLRFLNPDPRAPPGRLGDVGDADPHDRVDSGEAFGDVWPKRWAWHPRRQPPHVPALVGQGLRSPFRFLLVDPDEAAVLTTRTSGLRFRPWGRTPLARCQFLGVDEVLGQPRRSGDCWRQSLAFWGHEVMS